MTRPLAEQQMKAELLAQGLKLCTKCEEIKLVEKFSPRPKNSDGLMGWCKECYREHHRRWYQDNREHADKRHRTYAQSQKGKAYYKQYKEEHKEHLDECRRRWYEENRKEILVRGREYYYRTHDQRRATAKVYRQVCKVERNEYNKEWSRRNPDKARVYKVRYRTNNRERVLELDRLCSIRRRVKKANAEGSHTEEQWLELLSFFNRRCPCCGEEKKLTQDHIEPLDWGGSNYITNLQPLCKGCNSVKKNFYAIDYRPRHVRRWAHEEVMRELEEAELAEAA